jgi:RNA polymerase sigma-70 factor (ECF subfamily)
MLKVCRKYTRDYKDAEDVMQEGFVKVFRYLDQYDFKGSFEGWMKRIMVNTALQRFRSKSRSPMISTYPDDLQTTVIHNDVFSRLAYNDLMELIRNLPDSYRHVFNLYVIEGLKHKEIARELGISEGTSKSNLFDARNILQREIRNKIWERG